jgi:hypothetical protein
MRPAGREFDMSPLGYQVSEFLLWNCFSQLLPFGWYVIQLMTSVLYTYWFLGYLTMLFQLHRLFSVEWYPFQNPSYQEEVRFIWVMVYVDHFGNEDDGNHLLPYPFSYSASIASSSQHPLTYPFLPSTFASYPSLPWFLILIVVVLHHILSLLLCFVSFDNLARTSVRSGSQRDKVMTND